MITLKRRKFLVEKIVDFCKEMGANDVLTAVIPDQEPKLEFDIKSPLDEDENGQITLTGNKHQDMLGQVIMIYIRPITFSKFWDSLG